MICVLDFSGYFKRLNPAWEKTLGFTVEELLSKPFIEFVHPDDRERTLQQNTKVRTGGRRSRRQAARTREARSGAPPAPAGEFDASRYFRAATISVSTTSAPTDDARTGAAISCAQPRRLVDRRRDGVRGRC